MGNPIVSICCLTYNHRNYVNRTIDSFLNQKTNFPFEIIIHDDCSTDGTEAVVKKYAENYGKYIIPVIQKDNQYSQGIKPIFRYVFPLVRGKYIALCEGDDYWTDPYKLQKQVDFLEQNDDYSMVCTDYDTLDTRDQKIVHNHLGSKYNYNRDSDISIEDYLFKKRFAIRTLTVLFRSNVLQSFFDEVKPEIALNRAAGDVPLWLYILEKHKVRYMACSTAVYRISPGTVSRATDTEKSLKFEKTINEVLEYFIYRNDLPARYLKQLEIRKTLYRIRENSYYRNKTEVLKNFLILISSGSFKRRAFKYLFESFRKS